MLICKMMKKLIELHFGDQRWSDFVAQHPGGNIWQTWAWAEIMLKTKVEKVWCLAIDEAGANGQPSLRGGSLIYKYSLGKYCYLYAQGGLLVDAADKGSWDLLMQKIDDMAKKEKALFLLVDPLITVGAIVSAAANRLRDTGFRPAHKQVNPPHTLVIDITGKEDDILAQMKPKGRYNIRLAQRKELKYRISTDSGKDLDKFYKLLQATAKRDGIFCHGKEYYKQFLEILGQKHGMASLVLVEHPRGVCLAANLNIYFNRKAIYYYGASSDQYRALMAPYLAQWAGILEAKNRGCNEYDLLGIAPEDDPNHPYSCLTQFKSKFGGQRRDYIGAFEKVYRPKLYKMFLLTKRLRMFVRKCLRIKV